MAVRFHIHKEIDGHMCQLDNHFYWSSWSSLGQPNPREFATASGARNFIKSHGLRGAKPVRVETA